MGTKVKYEYDAAGQVLIKCSSGELPKIITKDNPVWRNFGPEDDSYARAIFLGQGCWERLETISEEDAQRILKEWGYLSHSANETPLANLPTVQV